MITQKRYGIVLFIGLLLTTFMHSSASADVATPHSKLFTNNTVTAEDDSSFERDDIVSLVSFLEKKGFNVQSLLDDSRFEIYDGIADRFRKSAERKSHTLQSYKKILNFDNKAQEIIEFMDEYSAQLKKAEERYGISKYVISAILGIESDFGKNIGNHNPFNAYVSMYAANYRRDFAKAQLVELLEFTNRKNIDVFELKSSYAGAMGFSQFIPYSLNKWFVGNDIFDMDNNIMSVANYLAYFKERTGSIKTAVLRYNPSSLYTDAVLDLATSAERRLPSD